MANIKGRTYYPERFRGGIETNTISERTSGSGVNIDGVVLKDGAITQAAGQSAVLDLSNIASGEGDIVLKDNLADAFTIREASNGYMTIVTTNGSEAVNFTKAVTTTDGVASGTARKVGGLASASIAASTAITGTTETETNFSTTYSLPANSLKAGTVVSIRAQGIHTATTDAETHTILLKLGSTTLASFSAVDPADGDIFYFDFEFVCRTNGATGTIVGCGVGGAVTPVTGTAKAIHLASTTIDTTAALVIAVAIDRQASATDGDSARLDYLRVTVHG